MTIAKLETPRGILNLKAGEKNFQLFRHFPPPEIGRFVEHYWIVRWDLRGEEPYLQETLPYPSFHLVLEQDNTRIVGIMRKKFAYLLKDKGQVFGVKFRPGAFYPFVKTSMSKFEDTSISFQAAFGIEAKPLEEAVLSLEDEGQQVALVNTFLSTRLPEWDENLTEINRIIEHIILDRTITRVDELVLRLNLNKRTLQRLFNQYVGASPKWVIKRYRVHEAAEQLATSKVVDWSKLAVELGYFDQAHFIKDFKTIVGKTPAEYAEHMGG